MQSRCVWVILYIISITNPILGILRVGTGNGARLTGNWLGNLKHGHGIIVCDNGYAIEGDPLFLYDKQVVPEQLESPDNKNSSQSNEIIENSLVSLNTTILSLPQIEPVFIPIFCDPRQINLKHLLDELLKTRKCNTKMCPTCSKFPSDEEYLNFEESRLRECIMDNHEALRNLYTQYATIADETNDHPKPVLIRFFLWQLYMDSRVNIKLPLFEVDAVLNDNPVSGVLKSHDPFERIYFWQFLISIIGVSWRICSSEYQRCDGGVLSNALKLFLQQNKFNFGKCKGALREYRDVLPLRSVYELYNRIGEFHTLRCLLRVVYSEESCYERLSRSIRGVRVVKGRNVVLLGENIAFIPDNIEFGQAPRDCYLRPEDIQGRTLSIFKNLEMKRFLKVVERFCPIAVCDGHIVNVDYKISFLEFFNVLIYAARAYVMQTTEVVQIKDEDEDKSTIKSSSRDLKLRLKKQKGRDV